jgi:hypothetical protein
MRVVGERKPSRETRSIMPSSLSMTLIADVPTTGYTIAEQKQILDALTGWFTASSGANATKFLGGES